MANDVREIKVPHNLGLNLYRNLEGAENDFEAVMQLGSRVGSELGTRRVWMLSSSAHSTSAAEMIPSLCRLLSDAGVDTRWLVIDVEDSEFFSAVELLEEKLYGQETGERVLADIADVFDEVSAELAEALQRYIDPRDILVAHGTAVAGIARHLPEAYSARLLWRCHSGHPDENDATHDGWKFLQPYLEPYARCIFSEQRYVPAYLRSKSTTITPGIDPLSHKNRNLRSYKLIGILRSAGLIERPNTPEWATFESTAKVLRNNTWQEEPLVSLLHRPQVVQISRFENLKGFKELLAGFYHMLRVYPERVPRLKVDDQRVMAELENVELILAGPDPAQMPEYPSAHRALKELAEQHSALPPEVARRVHILRLPIDNPKENDLIVNALQRLATVVVQNSLEQGFGLTVTEALWKGAPVVASDVGGIGLQIRSDIDGTLIDDPRDPDSVAMAILQVLADRRSADSMSRSAVRRVTENFLILQQLRDLLGEFREILTGAGAMRPRPVEASDRSRDRDLGDPDRTMNLRSVDRSA